MKFKHGCVSGKLRLKIVRTVRDGRITYELWPDVHIELIKLSQDILMRYKLLANLRLFFFENISIGLIFNCI